MQCVPVEGEMQFQKMKQKLVQWVSNTEIWDCPNYKGFCKIFNDL